MQCIFLDKDNCCRRKFSELDNLNLLYKQYKYLSHSTSCMSGIHTDCLPRIDFATSLRGIQWATCKCFLGIQEDRHNLRPWYNSGNYCLKYEIFLKKWEKLLHYLHKIDLQNNRYLCYIERNIRWSKFDFQRTRHLSSKRGTIQRNIADHPQHLITV